MLVRLLIISAIFSFVFVRSIEARQVQDSSFFDEPRPDTETNTESIKTEHRRSLHVATTPKNINKDAQRPSESVPATNHEPTYTGIAHPEIVYPKKRATNYKEGDQTDARPGCCG